MTRRGIQTGGNSDCHGLVHCPDCRYNGFNRLGDGRYQCKRCRKKFTPRQRKSRLPGHVIHGIASSFWLMVPAGSSCGRLGLNRKTVQRYYLMLRLCIMRNRERALREEFGECCPDTLPFDQYLPGGPDQSGQDRYPVFAIIARGGDVWIIFPEKGGHTGRLPETGMRGVAPDYWVCARDLRAWEKKEIDRFFCIPATGREEFWLFARRRLKKYHGGFKANFPLFIREMEFRFNHRHDPDVVAQLLNLLPYGPK